MTKKGQKEKEELDNTKGIIKIRKSKNRQYNGKK
jgi:hypothetical protein